MHQKESYSFSNTKYFFQVNSSSAVALNANLEFTPQQTDGKGVYLSEVTDYEIIKFVPKLSIGAFGLTLISDFSNKKDGIHAAFQTAKNDVVRFTSEK